MDKESYEAGYEVGLRDGYSDGHSDSYNKGSNDGRQVARDMNSSNGTTRVDILNAAMKCVCGKRQQDYGNPENNFAAIAAFWKAYKGIDFNAVDVAIMMALMKIARIKSGTATEDSFVDLAGYAACGGELALNSDSKR